MIRSTLIILMLFVFEASATGADWIPLLPGAKPGTPPAVRTLSSNAARTLLEISVPGFWVENTPYGSKLRFPGRIVSTDFGRPELPMVGCTVAMPQDTRPLLVLRDVQTVFPGKFRARMAPELEYEGQTNIPPAPVAPNQPYPTVPAVVTHTGLWRDVPLATIQIHPFRASGEGTLISVAVRLVIEVFHPGRCHRWPTATVPTELKSLLGSVAVNGSAVPSSPPLLDGHSTEYLVIAHKDLAASVQPLVDWRTRQGFAAEIVIPTAASPTPSEIKNEILARYDNGKGNLKFVLLVGDYEHLPWYVWNGNHSESWYACLTGGTNPDLYPDVGLGRLSGSNASQITHQVNRILAYEKNPAPGTWYDRIVLTAHKESGATGRFTTCCEAIANGPLKTSGWTTIKQYGYQSGVNNASLTGHINCGAGIVFYRGHGNTTSWSNWCNSYPFSFTTSNVAALANGGMTPVVFSICCTTGNFSSGTCYTEQWLRAQSGGAVACLGATDDTFTSGNTPMAIEFCRAIFQDGTTSIFGFHLKGITKALTVGGYGGQKAAYLFCWMGDACTNLWSKEPGTLTVSHPTVINTGQQSVVVEVRDGGNPVNGAKVCLYKGNEVFAESYTAPPQGKATISVNPASVGPLLVTVTAKDYRPYPGQIHVMGMVGTYTIDPQGSGPRNFRTLSAALANLVQTGVSGPVTFTLASTTYKETVTLSPVPGASSTNTITLVASGAPAVIDASGAQDGITLKDGCAYYRLENLKIQGFQRYGITLSGKPATPLGCHDNIFNRVEVVGPVTGNTNIRPLNVLHSDRNAFNYCQFRGGGVPLLFEGMRENHFEGCEFDGRGMSWELLVGFKDGDADNVFQNCFFHSCGPNSRGLYMNYDAQGNMFWHNTVIVNTSLSAAYLGGTSQWNTANSWRNNIFVNLGTGSCVVLGSVGGKLLCTDLAHNCYHGPNAKNGVITADGIFRGTLKDWIKYLIWNASIIPPGGGTDFGTTGIEGDPGLGSLTAPFDIHLKSTSPCRDSGTMKYVAGPWITFTPDARVLLDHEGTPRPDRLQVDRGADEVGPRITLSGSGKIGTPVNLALSAPLEPGRPYQVATALGIGPTEIDIRHLHLSLDNIFFLSITNLAPTIFIDYTGTLDGKGMGTAELSIPFALELVGFSLHTAFITLDPTAPSSIGSISNTESFTVAGP